MTLLPFFFLLATFFFSSSSVADQTLHSRHLLHQPFFPVVTTAPPPLSSQPPSPSPHIHHHHKKTHEKHLFSSLSNPPPPPPPPHTNPFFPSSSSTTSQPPPSPPHHSSLPTFPANISSLLFPPHTTTPSSHPHNNISKIITITASIISSLSLLSLFAVFIIFLRRTRRRHSSPQSDSLHLFNTTPSDSSLKKQQPPKYTSSNTSSEFLYLGTLVNSRLDQQQQKSPISVTTGVLELPPPPLTSSSPSSSSYHKLDSPELRPLPPLPKLFTPTYKSTEQLNPKDEFENDDEFFSPRGSSGRKQLSDSLINDSPLSLNSLNDSVSKQPGPIRPPPPPPPPLKELKEEESLKLKLKPLHWDKVRASSSRVTVWDQIKSNSFQLNEEMIETLFKANDPRRETEGGVVVKENQFLLDPRKSHNIAILLRALNVTVDEVCEALVEGNSDTLGPELLECLLKMAPTKEEQEKLKELKDDDDEESPSLGPAEKCLKALLNIPYAFKRIDAMLYIVNFESETEYLKRSFDTLKAACDELKNTRMFLKLLEAVLKTGNRMNTGTNRGDAHAFKLDTLLKLVDIKGTDGKTTLLHFVVQEIIKSEGARVSSSSPTQQSAFQVVSTLSSQMINVKKAAAMDSNSLSNETSEISKGITKVKEVIGEVKEETRFLDSMNLFMNKGEKEIIEIQSNESNVLKMVKEVTEYFQGNSEANNNPFQIFIVVRDFLMILDQVCKEVGRVNERTTVYGSVPRHVFPVVNSNSGSLEEEDSF